MVIGRGVTHFPAHSPHVRLLSFALNAYALLLWFPLSWGRSYWKLSPSSFKLNSKRRYILANLHVLMQIGFTMRIRQKRSKRRDFANWHGQKQCCGVAFLWYCIYHNALRFITGCRALNHLHTAVCGGEVALLDHLFHWYTFIYEAIIGLLPSHFSLYFKFS